jgi:hypothetical protein
LRMAIRCGAFVPPPAGLRYHSLHAGARVPQ